MQQLLADLNTFFATSRDTIGALMLIVTTVATIAAVLNGNKAHRLALRTQTIELTNRIYWASSIGKVEESSAVIYGPSVDSNSDLLVSISNTGVLPARITLLSCLIKLPFRSGRNVVRLRTLGVQGDSLTLAAGASQTLTVLKSDQVQLVMNELGVRWFRWMRVCGVTFSIRDDIGGEHLIKFAWRDRLRLARTSGEYIEPSS